MQNQALESAKKTAYYKYEFDVHGGAVGDITVDEGEVLPPGAVVTNGMIKVLEAVTSAGAATVALKIASSEDILAATGKASFTLNAALDVVPDGTASTSISTGATAYQGIVLTVGTAALTAGIIVVCLEYFLPGQA